MMLMGDSTNRNIFFHDVRKGRWCWYRVDTWQWLKSMEDPGFYLAWTGGEGIAVPSGRAAGLENVEMLNNSDDQTTISQFEDGWMATRNESFLATPHRKLSWQNLDVRRSTYSTVCWSLTRDRLLTVLYCTVVSGLSTYKHRRCDLMLNVYYSTYIVSTHHKAVLATLNDPNMSYRIILFFYFAAASAAYYVVVGSTQSLWHPQTKE